LWAGLTDLHRVGRRGWPTLQHWLWLLLCLAVVVSQAPAFVQSLYPPNSVTFDFYQDWASARNHLNGLPIYDDISLTIEQYLGWRLPESWPAWYWRANTHPPPAVLLTIPLARLEYREAFLLWSLLSLGLFGVTIWLLVRQFTIRLSAAWLVSGIAALLVWYPFREQVLQGQINLVLLFLPVISWAAHRCAWHWTAGAALGAATAIKLFPGLLLVYFVVRRQWRVVASSAAMLIAITVLCALVLGMRTYAVYLGEVLPASNQWLSHWYNPSLMAFWTKLFDPGPAGGAIIPAWYKPLLTRVGGVVSCAALIAILVRTTLRARSRSELDQAFGLTVTGMLLVSPITWSHSLVLLIIPLTFLWMHPIRSPALRITAIFLILTLAVPPHRLWQAFIPGGWPYGTVRPWQTLTALAFQCYAIVGLFMLQVAWLANQPESSASDPGERQRLGAVVGGRPAA
jgi:hypothetical protein